MDTDSLSLGTEVATWAIKDFSVMLRQQIILAARRQGCTVADWLHGYFQKHGIDGQQFAPVNLDPVELPSPAAAIDNLCRLVDAAAKVAEHSEKMQPTLRRLLSKRLREAFGEQPRAKEKLKALEAPSQP